MLTLISAAATWGILRGSVFFNKQLISQPSDMNLVRLWNLQDYSAILSLTSETLEKNPMDPYSLLFSGFAGYHKAVSQISAEEVNFFLNSSIIHLRKALIIEDIPKKEIIYYILGKAYLLKGRYYADLAVFYLNEALSLGYENADTYEFLGEAYSYLGDFEKSIVHYEKALDMFQSDRLYLKIAEDCFRNGLYNKSAEYYKILISETRDESLKKKGLFQLGKLYYDIKNLKMARDTFSELTELDPTVAEAHFLLGETYHMLGEPAEARSEWLRTVRIDPEHRGARLRLYK